MRALCGRARHDVDLAGYRIEINLAIRSKLVASLQPDRDDHIELPLGPVWRFARDTGQDVHRIDRVAGARARTFHDFSRVKASRVRA